MEPRNGIEDELPRLLALADLVKFARAEVVDQEAREAAAKVRSIVDHVEARLNPASEPAKRAAAAKERPLAARRSMPNATPG